MEPSKRNKNIGLSSGKSAGAAMAPSVARPGADYVASQKVARQNDVANMPAMPDVRWRHHFRCLYGTVTSVCVSSWVLFGVIPLIFYVLVSRFPPAPHAHSLPHAHRSSTVRLRRRRSCRQSRRWGRG